VHDHARCPQCLLRTVTSAVRGQLRNAAIRAEALSLIMARISRLSQRGSSGRSRPREPVAFPYGRRVDGGLCRILDAARRTRDAKSSHGWTFGSWWPVLRRKIHPRLDCPRPPTRGQQAGISQPESSMSIRPSGAIGPARSIRTSIASVGESSRGWMFRNQQSPDIGNSSRGWILGPPVPAGASVRGVDGTVRRPGRGWR
jgi:hypothetical protein